MKSNLNLCRTNWIPDANLINLITTKEFLHYIRDSNENNCKKPTPIADKIACLPKAVGTTFRNACVHSSLECEIPITWSAIKFE